MNTNLSTGMNGIRELTADDLDSVSGGDAKSAVVGYVIEKLVDSVFFVAALREKATGTLKGIGPMPK